MSPTLLSRLAPVLKHWYISDIQLAFLKLYLLKAICFSNMSIRRYSFTICYNLISKLSNSRIWQYSFYYIFTFCMENSVDSDQMVSEEASWTGSPLFSMNWISTFFQWTGSPLFFNELDLHFFSMNWISTFFQWTGSPLFFNELDLHFFSMNWISTIFNELDLHFFQ